MRTTFINQLVEEARKNDKIFLLVGDLGYNVVEPFANEFPDRFINVGICEQNMAGIAGGLAMNGWIVYCYSIGNFPTLRCIEQIRNDIVYYNSNVRIVSVGAGYAYGSQGVSHQATEEIGMLRTLPNMVICSPSDPLETKMIVKQSVTYQGPMYIRLGKAGEKNIWKLCKDNCIIGDILPYRIGKNKKAILVTGSIASSIINESKSEQYDIYTVPYVKPLNNDGIIDIANKYNEIVVVEEHQKSCGVGSAIIERISDLYTDGSIDTFPRVKRIAINDEFCEVSGSQNYLREVSSLKL